MIIMDRFFDLHRPMIAGSYRPERLLNSALFNNLSKILPLDVKEDENSYIIIADVPGVDEKNIEVNFENNSLTIAASQELEEENDDIENSRTLIKERTHHKQTIRNITLGSRQIDAEKITAELRNGVLTVIVPFAEETLPKKIEVKNLSDETPQKPEEATYENFKTRAPEDKEEQSETDDETD